MTYQNTITRMRDVGKHRSCLPFGGCLQCVYNQQTRHRGDKGNQHECEAKNPVQSDFSEIRIISNFLNLWGNS